MVGLMIKKNGLNNIPGKETGGEKSFAINEKEREWKDIYLKGRKVGYTVNLIQPFEEGYYIQEEIFLKLNLMGMGRNIYTITQSSVDKKFILKNFYFKMSSGVVNYRISGIVDGNRLTIKSGKGRKQRTKKILLSKAPMIGAGIGPMLKTLKLNIGDSFRLPFFDPSTMSQNEVTLKVAERETIKLNNITYEAFRVETEIMGSSMNFWLDEKGSVLKEEGVMGLVMIRSSAANAPFNIEGEGREDFYEISAIPVDREIPSPDHLEYLKMRLSGIDQQESSINVWGTGRQNFNDGIMEIRLERLPFKPAYSIPYTHSDGKMAPFLEAEFNIESDLKEIKDKARDIIGDEKDPVTASRKLMNWIYDKLEKRPVVSVPSAIEVLRTRAGDCNEHATLLTALLRASGIPARLSIGLVYNKDKFFYHAWTEAYLGEWISMDATLNQMPADVSHIRLMSGNLDKQIEIMGLIGKLKLEVLHFEYNRNNRFDKDI